MSLRLNHFLGGVFLISGTAIGAGMLALPLATAFAGFFPSTLLLVSSWLFMLITAFLFLEVNLYMEGDVNLVTMASNTLGSFGRILSWGAYLLLLYCLNAAYISGSSAIFSAAFKAITGSPLPTELAVLFLLIFFGYFVYSGTRAVDLINRVFIAGLILSYTLLAFTLPSHMQWSLLDHMDKGALLVAIPVVITSFGFHIVIPTLVSYMKRDRKKLRLAVFIGSVIPLIIYLLWEFLVLGTIPLSGNFGLAQTYLEGESITIAMGNLLKSQWIAVVANSFSFFAIITSFLGVSLSLSGFLRDGLKIKRDGRGKFLILLLTFVPPILFVLTYKNGFIVALQYAAIFVALLLGILPALMAWTLPKPSFFRTIGGRALLVTIILLSLCVIYVDIMQEQGLLKGFTEAYSE